MTCSVKLIAHTNDAVRVVAAAAKLCYSASDAVSLFDGLDNESVRGFLNKLRSIGHLSPFEHASYTFAIDSLSRVASHQLVRHRLASFSQQSQRYVSMGSPRVVMPETIAANSEAKALFEKQTLEAHKAYSKLTELGIPKEDARFILPHGWETSLVLSMNARELHHFFSLRLCRRAQWEIRELARQMLVLVLEATPELFEKAGPSCVSEDSCREAHPCGHPYADMKDLMGRA